MNDLPSSELPEEYGDSDSAQADPRMKRSDIWDSLPMITIDSGEEGGEGV